MTDENLIYYKMQPVIKANINRNKNFTTISHFFYHFCWVLNLKYSGTKVCVKKLFKTIFDFFQKNITFIYLYILYILYLSTKKIYS